MRNSKILAIILATTLVGTMTACSGKAEEVNIAEATIGTEMMAEVTSEGNVIEPTSETIAPKKVEVVTTKAVEEVTTVAKVEVTEASTKVATKVTNTTPSTSAAVKNTVVEEPIVEIPIEAPVKVVEPETEAPTKAPVKVVEPVTEAPTEAPVVVEPVTEAPTEAPASNGSQFYDPNGNPVDEPVAGGTDSKGNTIISGDENGYVYLSDETLPSYGW